MSAVDAGMKKATDSFPIPMRGNETWMLLAAADAQFGVPDPHEG